MNKELTLCFFGSRTLNDQVCRNIIENQIEEKKPTSLVTSGGINGICELTIKIAKEKAIPIELHWLNKRYLKGMYEHRSKEILKKADYIIFIHDGKSKGTQNEIKLAEKMSKKYKYYLVENNKTELYEMQELFDEIILD